MWHGCFFSHFSRLGRLDLRSDPVQVAESLGGETATTVGVLLHQLDGFEGLQHFTSDRAGAAAEMWWPHTVVLVSCKWLDDKLMYCTQRWSRFTNVTSVDPLDSLDSNGGPNVNVPSQRSHANEEPIFIKGSQLFVDGSFDKVSPFWSLHFARPEETYNISTHNQSRILNTM